MPFQSSESKTTPVEMEVPCLDLTEGGPSDGLLFRLQNQNRALERLRQALDGENDDVLTLDAPLYATSGR